MRRLPILLALLPVVAGCGEQRRQAREPWVTYTDTARAFSISYPASWQRAKEPLTPTLADPHEILTLGSGSRLRPGGERCSHVPENAMRDLGRGDVLLSLQERRGSGGFGDRVRPFRLEPRHLPAAECSGRTDIRESFTGFRDAGRGLHVLAALGPGADDADERTLERVVDSLVLEPAWRSRRTGLRMQPPAGWRVRAGGRHLHFGSFDVRAPPVSRCALPSGAERLPADGAYAFVFEYVELNRTQRMRFPSARRLSLRPRDRRTYECFGDSWLFRWRDKGRVFQAHAYLGPGAGARRRAELLAALRSIVVVR